MTLINLILVGVGGALGAMSRFFFTFLLSQYVQTDFPIDTFLIINVSMY